MKQVLTLCFLCILIGVNAQFHCVKLNTTFILTNFPVGGFGYEYCSDSSNYSIGINAEVGRYNNNSINTANSSIDSYSLAGVALMPEFRNYFGGPNWLSPRGFFATVYSRIRYLRQSVQYGVRYSPGGYQLDSPHTAENTGFAIDYGLGFGFKTGKKIQGIHVEAVVGYGISHSRLYLNTGNRQAILRFDLSLSGIFQKRNNSPSLYEW